MNEHLEALRVQGAKIGLKVNVKKTVDSFTYLGGNISQDGGSTEDDKSRIAKAQSV